MDSFTETILNRARERQKKIEKLLASDGIVPFSSASNENNTSEFRETAVQTHTVVEPQREIITSEEAVKVDIIDTHVNDSNVPFKFKRQNSKIRISSDVTSSPQDMEPKMLNIKRDNFNMEIKVSSTESVRLEVEIEEENTSSEGNSQGDNSFEENLKSNLDDNCDGSQSQLTSKLNRSAQPDESNATEDSVGLREEAKSRLKRLGKLYAGGNSPDISSPIHKTEAKFYQMDDILEVESRSDVERKGKGLKRLADLAHNINEWEDEIKTPKNPMNTTVSKKKNWKAQAPKPPVSSNSSPGKQNSKPKATSSPATKNNKSSRNSLKKDSFNQSEGKKDHLFPRKDSSSKVNMDSPSRQLKWEKNILETLESQGFTRTNSNSRLIYSYNSKDDDHKGIADLKSKKNHGCVNTLESNLTKNEDLNLKQNPSGVEKKAINNILSSKVYPRSPSKSLSGMIATKAQIFQSNSTPEKDPALLSVSERKALFEKNRGQAPIPKAPFAMAVPMDNKKTPTQTSQKANINSTIRTQTTSSKINRMNSPLKTSIASTKTDTDKPKVNDNIIENKLNSESSTKASVPQAKGIAKTMAALLESKSTISQAEIENNIRKERRREMEVLLNRFNKTKSNTTSERVTEDPKEKFVGKDEGTEIPIISSAPPLDSPDAKTRRSGNKRHSSGRCSTADSPKVAAALEDIKRIKFTPPKMGKLYPNLSDIEAATETEPESQTRTPSPNSTFSDNTYTDSDDANTSFGREILQTVCQNQTPQKRPVYEEYTASDVSDVLDDMDDGYIDEALAYANESPGPTPPKHSRSSPDNQPQPSHSFNYKNYSPKKTVTFPQSDFKSPNPKYKTPSPKKKQETPKSSATRRSSDLPSYVVDGDNVLPLTHTVSFYRKQQENKTPTRQISRQPIIEEENKENVCSDNEMVRQKMCELQEEVNREQLIISQTSQAINLCSCTPEFMGSTEHVEAEKVLLIATHRRQAALNELQRMSIENTLRPILKYSQNLPAQKREVIVSNIVLPLKREYVRALAAAGGMGHHVLCLIKCGEKVVATKLVSTVVNNSKNPEMELKIPGTYDLNDIYSDFTIIFEVYCLQAQEEFLPHEVKYHINTKKNTNKTTPKKSKQESRLVRPPKESPAGPHAVRSPTFAIMGYVALNIQAINKKSWSLNNAPSKSPLEGTVEMHVSCKLDVSVEHRGFLTMFEDVSGFGAWHRRWCLLKGHLLSYWKYPEDERKTAPIDTIDLKICVTDSVGAVSRDICARMNTFLLERERDAYPSDKDTLVMVCKGDKTILRHLLSADTKEERIEWCNKLNAALNTLRMCGGMQK